MVAFERNLTWHMTEDLKQAGIDSALEKPVQITAQLAETGHVYDLHTGKYLEQTDKLSFELSPWQPSLFATLPMPLPAGIDLIEFLLR